MAPFTLVKVLTLSATTIDGDDAVGFFEAFRCVNNPDPYAFFAISMRESIFQEHSTILPNVLRNLVLAY
jgi:hypothetical protein